MTHRSSNPADTLGLVGRVIGPDGHGVADARVWIDSIPEHTATSSGDGTFEFEDLLARTYEVRALAGELVGGPQVIRVVERVAPVVIKLREGAHIVVTVVDPTRAPVANATVRVIGSDSNATTDASGQARVTAHPGWVAVEATRSGYAPRRVSVTSASSGSTARTTIVLHEGFEVGGRVVDESRKPIPNVRIYARQLSGIETFDENERATAVTDDAGAFAIPSAVGMHSFIAVDDEHAPTMTPTFDIDRPTTDIEIVMKTGSMYAGRVVGSDGKPAAGAQVHVETMGPLGLRRFSTSTDTNGAFEIGALPRTMATARAVSDDGASDAATLTLNERPELLDQTLALKRSDAKRGVIAGIVVDDTGAPVADVLVNASARRHSMAELMSPSDVDTSVATSTNTNQRGEFAFPDLPAGEYGVWAGPFDQPPFPAEAAKYIGAQDASSFMTFAKTGDKSMRLVMPRAGRIAGKVSFGDNGDGVDEFTVDVEPRSDRFGLTSGEHGAFEVRDLRPGTYVLHVTGRDFVRVHKVGVRVEAGKSTDIGPLTVDRGRTLAGKVVDTAGRGVAGARVMVGYTSVYGVLGRFDEPDRHQPGALTDMNGAFTITGGIERNSVVRRLFVGADHPSLGRSLPVELPPGTQDPPPVTLTLLECGSIVGKVTQSGQPLAGAIVGAGWPELGAAHTNDDGAFVMSRLPAGPIAIRVHASSDLTRSHQSVVHVEPGTQREVAIDVPVGAIKLAVTVKPRPGEQVPGAMLYLFRGTVSVENYAQLLVRIFPESQGIVLWAREAHTPAEFTSLVPGDYTVCTMPLAWNPNDEKLLRQLRTMPPASVKVYCTPARVAAAPVEQVLSVEVPSMALPP